MSFLSKALRRAEVFLEQVDESVAQASRRAVVEGATGDVEDEAWVPMSDDPLAAGVMGAGTADGDADTVDAVSRPPVQRRRGIANIRRAPVRRGPGAADGASSFDEGAREELASAAGTHGSVGSARSPPGSIVSTHVPESLAATDEPAEEKGQGGEEAEEWGDFDIPDSELDGTENARQSLANSGAVAVAGGHDDAVSTPGKDEANSGRCCDSISKVSGDGMPVRGTGTGGVVALGDRVGDDMPASTLSNTANDVDVKKLPGRIGSNPKTRSSRDALDEADITAFAAEVPESGRSDEAIVPKGAVEAETAPYSSSVDDGAQNELDDSMRALLDENDELRKELELAEEDFDNMLKERSKLLQNLKSLKEVIAEQEETLQEKSTEVRRLGEAMVDARDEKNTLHRQLKESVANGKGALDLMQKNLSSQLTKMKADLVRSQAEEQRLQAENASIKDALAKGREVDMLTADGARDQASKAQRAYEAEVVAHRETREALSVRQEALDSEAALAAEAIAAAQRKADDAQAAAVSAREAQRAAESRLARLTSARDAALALVEDLTKELSPYKSSGDGQPPGHEELQSMQQTVVELEHALEAKNVELTRLEGDVENMRSLLDQRNEAARLRSPGGGSGATGEYANGHEVEQKLRHMADSALRKQAQVEVLRSENKALQHQLDTERKRTREAQAMAAVATSSRHNLRGSFRGIVDGGDEERGERGYGVREGPVARFRAPRNWPLGVTRFLASLDKLTAQALGFLRKEPLVRMAILVYVVAMHVVLYGLLHYHAERTMTDPEGTLHAHPHAPLVLQHEGKH
jgi:uncharacterized protein YoxC